MCVCVCTCDDDDDDDDDDVCLCVCVCVCVCACICMLTGTCYNNAIILQTHYLRKILSTLYLKKAEVKKVNQSIEPYLGAFRLDL